jgi:hypothetical protein
MALVTAGGTRTCGHSASRLGIDAAGQFTRTQEQAEGPEAHLQLWLEIS